MKRYRKVSDIPEDGIVFYDIETTSVHAAYTELKMIGYQVGFNSKPKLVDASSKESCSEFKRLVNSPEIIKVSHNGINFDDIVLYRYGFFVNPINRHDMFLALKTVHPSLAAYGLKFVNYAINNREQTIDDAWHIPEYNLQYALKGHKKELGEDMYSPNFLALTEEYCKHDVTETVYLFRAIWELVNEDAHWKPYIELELAMGEPLHEMILLGQEYLDLDHIQNEIDQLAKRKQWLVEFVNKKTNGRIANIGSNKQTTQYMFEEFNIEFFISEAGNRLARKSDWLKLMMDAENEFVRMTYADSHDRANKGTGPSSLVEQQINKILEESRTFTLKDFAEQWDKKPLKTLAAIKYEVTNLTKLVGYYNSYLKAGKYELQRRRASTNSQRTNGEFHPIDITKYLYEGWDRRGPNIGKGNRVTIPKSYRLSAARTRRFQSSSQYGINFQNQNKRTKVVQLVPKGWLGFWIDSTQIENVVHIWASHDEDFIDARRAAYIADPDWSEYVWLCNEVLGEENDRKALEARYSPINPAWSIYKQYKTIKLALNFGMGSEKFAKTTGLEQREANRAFEEVHTACPAIRHLQHKIRKRIEKEGWVKDPWGHVYTGKIEKAYKIVSYLVQGCGTGSVPKAMTIANWNTLHSYDTPTPEHYPYVKIPYRKKCSYGILCGTTHDECAGRISLGLSNDTIISIVKQLMFNMEEKFSPLFGDIPLRAKLAVSTENAAEQIELDHRPKSNPNFVADLTKIINEGKRKMKL